MSSRCILTIFQDANVIPGISILILPEQNQVLIDFQIPDLVLHCTALAFSFFLSWRLLKV